jgi:hypothetical protein
MLLRCLCLYIRCGFCLWPNLKDTTMSFSGKNGARPIMFSTRFCRALSRCPNLDRNVGSICGCSPFLKLNHTRVQVRHQLGRLSRGIEDHQDENSETQANSPQRNTFRRNAAGGHLAGLQSLRRAVCEVRLQHPCSNNQVFLTFLAMQGYFFNAAQYKGFSTRLLPAPSRDTTYDRGPGACRAHPVKRSEEAPSSLSSHSFVCCLSKYVPNHSLLSSIDSQMSRAPPLFSSATGLIGHRIRSTTAWIHRHSVLSSSALPPPLLVYQQLIATSRPYLHCATGVEPA